MIFGDERWEIFAFVAANDDMKIRLNIFIEEMLWTMNRYDSFAKVIKELPILPTAPKSVVSQICFGSFCATMFIS